MFTILVGRPGLGKGAAVNPALSILREAGVANVLSDRLTIEYILERMSKGFTHTTPTPTGGMTFGTDSSVLVYSPELSIFVSASSHTLPILADLWDARDGEFMYGTRHKGAWNVKDPCVSLLACSAPRWLVDSIPSSAVGGGFTRRVNFVYGKDKQKLSMAALSQNGSLQKVKDSLVNDLRHISSHIQGPFTLDKGAEGIFEKVYREDADEFSDEATASYVSSKWVHASKLAMAISAATDDRRVIDKTLLEFCVSQIEEVEKTVKMVFRAVGDSDLSLAADKVLRYVEARGYATRNEILGVLWKDVSSLDLDLILMTLTQGGILKERVRGQQLVYQTAAAKVAKGVTP